MPIPGITASQSTRAHLEVPNVKAVDCNQLDCSRLNTAVATMDDKETTSGTFSCWVNVPNNSSNTFRYLFSTHAVDDTFRILIRKDNIGRLSVIVANNAGNQLINAYTTDFRFAVPAYTWRHIFVSFNINGPLLNIYVDGVEQALTLNTFINGNWTKWEQCKVLGYTLVPNGTEWNHRVAQLWFKDEYIEPTPANLQYFYNNGSVEFRDDGVTGCWSPLVYFEGYENVWNSADGNLGYGGPFAASANDVINAATSPPNGLDVDPYITDAVNINGSTYLDRLDQPLIGIANTKEFTFSAWVWYAGTGTTNTFSCMWEQAENGAYKGLVSIEEATGDVRVIFRNIANAYVIYFQSDGGVPLNEWSHILLSFDTATLSVHLYINNQEIPLAPSHFLQDSEMDISTRFNTIGYRRQTGGNKFTGDMADFFVDDTYYDITDPKVRAKFITTNGQPTDLSLTTDKQLVYIKGDVSNWNSGTNSGSGGDFDLTGSFTDSNNEPIETPNFPDAVNFDGNDYLSRTSSLNGIKDGKQFTLSFWIYYQEPPSLNQAILAIDDGADIRFIVDIGGVTDQPRIIGWSNTGGVVMNINGGIKFKVNQWNHMIVSGDLASSVVYVYTNGVQSQTGYTVNNDMELSGQRVGIAHRHDASHYLYSDLAELYFDDVYYDITDPAVREQFVLQDNKGVLTPSRPIGNERCPLLYMSGGADRWNAGINKGTGGDFTMTGLVDGSFNEPVAVIPPPNTLAINTSASTRQYRALLGNLVNNGYGGTFSVWFKTTLNSRDNIISSIYSDAGTTLVMELSLNSIGAVRCQMWSQFGDIVRTDLVSPLDTYNDGEWHHVLCIMGSSLGLLSRMWIDGTLVITDSGHDNSTTFVQGASVCARYDNSDAFDGDLAQFYFRDVWLEASDLSKFYNNGSVDMGPNGTGTSAPAPQIYFQGDSVNWFINGGIGGVFTNVGSITDATTNPPNGDI